MMLFFVIAALMVIVAVGVTIVPIVRSRMMPQDRREIQNIAIARERLALVEAQAASSVITREQADQEKSEIELSLLDDVGRTASGPPPEQPVQSGWGVFVVVAAAVPTLAGILYLTLGQPVALVPVPAAETADATPHSSADLTTMVQRLEQRLTASPTDVEGWQMLGNSYMMMKQFDRAALVFQKMRELVGDNADLLVRQADAMAMARGGALDGEPEALVARALQMNPNHPIGLWLAGLAARRKGDYRAAVEYWQRAEPLFAGDPSRAELKKMIARTREAMTNGGSLATREDDVSAAPDSTAAPPEHIAGQVKVNVTLDDSLRDRVNDQDTLFVFARALNGPPMPLAVVRKRVADLPLAVTLDDSMAMTPQMKLSSHKEVTVIAKVSRTGEAKTQSGDLIGEVSPVSTGNNGIVRVVIATQAP